MLLAHGKCKVKHGSSNFTKKGLLCLCTSPHIRDNRPGASGVIKVAQQMYGAFEAPSSLGNSFLSHNYPAAILSTAVLLSFEKRNDKK